VVVALAMSAAQICRESATQRPRQNRAKFGHITRVLGGLADVERDLIRTRTAEGRSRAKARGKHMGRPPSLTPAQQKEATRRRAGCDVAGIGG
jgi:DNA invertase Pin-like site-specific DNA recombinase